MNPDNFSSNEGSSLFYEDKTGVVAGKSELDLILARLSEVCDNIFMNLDECFDLSQISEYDFKCKNYVNQWVLSEFFLLDDKVFRSIEKMKLFINETICTWYWGLVQSSVYNRDSKDREECFLVALYIFSKIFESVKNLMSVDLFQNSIIDGMVFSRVHRKVEKRWNEICNDILILESIMRANFVIRAASMIKSGFMRLSIDGEEPTLLMKNATVYINTMYETEVLNDIRRLCKVKYVDLLTDKNVIDKNMFEETMLVEYAILFDDNYVVETELQKLEKFRDDIHIEIQRVTFLLENPTFIEKAPKEKLEEERKKYEYYSMRLEELNKIEGYLKKFVPEEIVI